MSEFFLGLATEDDIQFDGFFDGQQKLIPKGTILDVVVIDGFNGIEEGKAVNTCFIQVAVTSPGEFLGQKYKWNAKIYDMDAGKRDRALQNLTLLDTQAGSPLGKSRLSLSTENIQEHWVGASNARAKFEQYQPEPDDRDPDPEPKNYISGFGYLREKLPQKDPASSDAEATEGTKVTEEPKKTSKDSVKKDEPEIDF